MLASFRREVEWASYGTARVRAGTTAIGVAPQPAAGDAAVLLIYE